MAPPKLYAGAMQQVLVLQEVDPDEPLPKTSSDAAVFPPPWRVIERMKTANALLVLCLNIGVDPPDVEKPPKTARMECWVTPNTLEPQRSLQVVSKALQAQYERWQPRARYRVSPDPTAPELNRQCTALRRNAREERVLFHYNGHGVPKPTGNGEIWVFNQNYTQYIPVNLYDLVDKLGTPSLYVFDCNSAGTILYHFRIMQEQYNSELEQCRHTGGEPTSPDIDLKNTVVLGACGEDEILPTNPDLPADLFTSCLTTPIKMSLRWYIKRSLVTNITVEMLDRIPGNLNDRQTALGELNWIFTAITDTIAWNVLDQDMFKRLFRQDLLLASLMRNFLLADRIFRFAGCTPVSEPPLPETHEHPLWDSFEYAIEQCLSQLPAIIATEDAAKAKRENGECEGFAQDGEASSGTPLSAHSDALPRSAAAVAGSGTDSITTTSSAAHQVYRSNSSSGDSPIQMYSTFEPSSRVAPWLRADDALVYLYRSASFFEDQMKAFEIWLNIGPDGRLDMGTDGKAKPEQLPIMLQVLLNPVFRVNALKLISRYMQTGPHAVHLALSVGIFPYVLKLLQSPIPELRQELVFIWGKVLTIDQSCQSDLVKEKGEEYFVRFLEPCADEPDAVYLAVAAFVLSVVAREHADRCRTIGVINVCYARLKHPSPFVRRWACLCMTQVLLYASSPVQAENLMCDDLITALQRCANEDTAPDVRAAAVSALSAILSAVLQDVTTLEREIAEDVAISATLQGHENGQVPLSQLQPGGLGSGSETNVLDAHDAEPGIESVRESECQAIELAALSRIGIVIARIARRDCSVLVRREIAIAMAKSVQKRLECFVRAARERNPAVVDSPLGLYQSMWKVLSELAFDPHPIIAALATRQYDVVDSRVRSLEGSLNLGVPSSNEMDVPATDHLFSPPASNSSASPPGDGLLDTPGDILRSGGEGESIRLSNSWQGDLTGPNGTAAAGIRASPRFTSRAVAARAIAQSEGTLGRREGSIHVRSPSGNFSLTSSPGRPRLGDGIPRVNSVILIPPTSASSWTNGSGGAGGLDIGNDDDGGGDEEEEGEYIRREARSHSPTIALVAGLNNLSNLWRWPYGGSRSNGVSNSGAVNGARPTGGSLHAGSVYPHLSSASPPRPPRRTLSYQVLSAASTLSPHGAIPSVPLPRQSSYAPHVVSRTDMSSLPTIPQGYDRLYLSGAGDAALSLYEWSRVCISQVEFDATTTDYLKAEEPIPAYAMLWMKLIGKDSVFVDSLMEFAVQGDCDSLGVAPEGSLASEVEVDELANARELSCSSMGAGGGSIISMAFLPRDVGTGDDQLLATGDSQGSVGVYDVMTGVCQGSFGIPGPPGITEVGVSAMLCLNAPTPSSSGGDSVFTNSRSALVMAGAYDGRVAVYKSDLRTSKYSIMSAFQASGESIWNKKQSTRPVVSSSKEDTLRDFGNGLVLSFDSASAYLAAAGCERQSTRVWDMTQEKCIWEGLTMGENAWPTAISMSKWIHPSVIVLGASNGAVNMLDMRDCAVRSTGGAAGIGNGLPGVHTLGLHRHPVISIAMCPMTGFGGDEVVVTADIGGDIVFWDPRWSGSPVVRGSRANAELSRLKAHKSNLTTMTVHPSGHYLASGSTAKCVKIFSQRELLRTNQHQDRGLDHPVAGGCDLERKPLNMIRHHDRELDHPVAGGHYHSQPGARIAPVTSLAFQPESSLLAIGCRDSTVMIYGNKEALRARSYQ